MKKYLLCLMALCFLFVGNVSFAETELNLSGVYQKQEYLMTNTLGFGKGTYYDLTTQAIVLTDLQTQEVECKLYMQKLNSEIIIGHDEVEELLVMLPILKDFVQNETRGKTEYVYQTKSGVYVAVEVDAGVAAFVFKLHPNDNTASSTFNIGVLDRLVEYLNEYAVFFRGESK